MTYCWKMILVSLWFHNRRSTSCQHFRSVKITSPGPFIINSNSEYVSLFFSELNCAKQINKSCHYDRNTKDTACSLLIAYCQWFTKAWQPTHQDFIVLTVCIHTVNTEDTLVDPHNSPGKHFLYQKTLWNEKVEGKYVIPLAKVCVALLPSRFSHLPWHLGA